MNDFRQWQEAVRLGYDINDKVKVSFTYRRLDSYFEYPDTMVTEDSTFDEIYECYERGDELVVWAVTRQARYLAYGITGLIFVLNPDVIILGDEIIHSQKFLDTLQRFMKEYLPKVFHEELDIRISTLKQNSVLKGAGISMVKSYFQNYGFVDFIAENYPKLTEA